MQNALTVHATKTNLSRLLREVDSGGKVVFGARGQATYQITKLHSPKGKSRSAYGAWKGKVWTAPDAFSPETDTLIWEDFWKKNT
jgi:antitoxin (DNA-binding transcriptional repressor) of toxin-antitoxin stability system